MSKRARSWGAAIGGLGLLVLAGCGSSRGGVAAPDAGSDGAVDDSATSADGSDDAVATVDGSEDSGANPAAEAGDAGGTGDAAAEGDAGSAGDVGAAGDSAAGDSATARDAGTTGDAGAAGDTGSAGDAGTAGDSGLAPCVWPGDGVPTVVSVPTGGPAVTTSNGVIARAGNGHVLAIWTQAAGGQTHMFGAEFDGMRWGQPVDLGPGGSAPTVAATAATFVVAWSVSGVRYAATWTGTGLSTPANLGSSFLLGSFRVASDSTRLVAVWSAQAAINSASGIWSSTSADNGVTWGSAVAVETETGYQLRDLVGGPAGVAELAVLPSGMIAARVAQFGAWGPASAAMKANVDANGLACEVSVGTADALVACVSATTDTQLFDGKTWTDRPFPGPAGSLFSLGSNGADYRIDFVYGVGPLSSTVLHAGVWSTPVTSSTIDPLPVAPKSNYTAGMCGTWTLFYADNSTLSGTLFASQTSGGAAYPKGAQLVAGQASARGPRIAAWPGVVDAVWSGVSPTSSGTSVLYVALNAK